MRVLVVGEVHERKNGNFFYSTTHKLINGFIRNDCSVVSFNERELARSATIFHNKKIGRRAMNQRLLETVENFVPHIIVLCHADLVEPATLKAIRAKPDRPKIILRCVDALFQPKTILGLMRFADYSDAIFITTAGNAIKQFSGPARVVSFMPNPVDESMESFRAFENLTPDFDVFFASRYARSIDRLNIAQDLQTRLPHVRFDYRGFNGKDAVYGFQFGQAMSKCRMGLSLDKETGWYLYASARMSQYMGNGLLTFVHKSTHFDEIFTDDELVLYDDTSDLEEKIRHYSADDDKARTVARQGHAKIHDYFKVSRVVKYILDVTLERGLSEDYPWPTDLV